MMAGGSGIRSTLAFAAIGCAAIGGLALTPLAAHAADKVSVVMDAGFNGRHAYYFVAIERGYYESVGLDVQVVRGQGSVDAIKQVAAGNAQFGFADAGSVVLARGNEQVPVKLLAIVYARPPHAIYALKETGIGKPKDLEGRKIANPAGGAIPKMFPAYAKAAGIDAGKVTWVVAPSESLPSLLTLGRVDAVGQFTVGEPLLRKQAAPKELVELSYASAGLDFYGNGLIAADNTIEKQRDLARRFVAATLRGLADAIADPPTAARILNKHHREVEVEIATGEIEKVRSLAVVPQAALGAIDAGRVRRTIELVSAAFDMKNPVTPQEVFVPDMVAR
jgi:NitT/TauT family transport system substrate-binding protein